MDIQSVLGIGAPTAGGLMWWLLQGLHKRIDELEKRQVADQKQLDDFKLHCEVRYVTSDELSKAFTTFNDSIRVLFGKLDRIEDKIDLKADK